MVPMKAHTAFTAETAPPHAVVMAFTPGGRKKQAPVKTALRMPRQRQALAVAR